MLKRICKKKIIISSIILLLIGILYKIPNKNNNDYNNIPKKISYVNYELQTNEVYLLDENNYLTRVKIQTKYDKEKLVKEILNILICNEDNDKIPNGFKCLIDKNTKINNVEIKNNTVKIDLSKELFNTKTDEIIIESIIYSLTSIDNINNVIIYIDGKLLNKLPNMNINIKSPLDRGYGINKKYEINDTKNITKTTIFYVNDSLDNTYYTPITLINNDTRDKIEIVIDELSNKIVNNKLKSYLNNDTKVLNSHIKDNTMYVNFNENILDNFENNNILEEVIYTVALSIGENYDIKNVFFDVNNKEIAKTTIKSLE